MHCSKSACNVAPGRSGHVLPDARARKTALLQERQSTVHEYDPLDYVDSDRD